MEMANRPRICVISKSFGQYCKEALEILKSFSEVEIKSVKEQKEIIDVVKEFDGIIVGNEKINKEIINNAVRLKIIARHGVGIDNIDIDAATERGIVVTYTPQANSDSVAEYTIALILNIMRMIPKLHNITVNGGWNRILGYELMGKTVGIIGFGGIGKRVAKKLGGFDVKILVYDPYVKEEDIKKFGATPAQLDELLKTSDIITLHVALTSETKHLITRDKLKLMKNTAYLINTSRGAVVDEKALYEALKERWIAGAALDVFEEEPINPRNPLLTLENVIVTPHNANFTLEALRRTDLMNAEDLRRFFNGQKPTYIANPQVYSK
ncbi:MAG: phosphoglycerate dehydrogenase [Nitrososphaeria archaeon]|nr:phosphoglycerate dehydrogenase [Nitrososphaeria archaeon]